VVAHMKANFLSENSGISQDTTSWLPAYPPSSPAVAEALLFRI
jgi:hypothetical protein